MKGGTPCVKGVLAEQALEGRKEKGDGGGWYTEARIESACQNHVSLGCWAIPKADSHNAVGFSPLLGRSRASITCKG